HTHLSHLRRKHTSAPLSPRFPAAMSTDAAAADIPVPQVEATADPVVETTADAAAGDAKATKATKAKAKAAKTPKAKKPSAPRKPKATPAHPTYAEMVTEAIAALKERNGSSTVAIAKYIEDKHKAHLPANFRKFMLTQIKKLVAAGKLTKVKASYKLTKAPAAPKKPKTKAPAKKKPAAKKKAPAKKAKK
uniref:H15 domain-containing protein n=1 Tax=Aegilops tauschii subsp. strangulata TaxID=200361 RepID=A0A453M3K1_AEGTS